MPEHPECEILVYVVGEGFLRSSWRWPRGCRFPWQCRSCRPETAVRETSDSGFLPEPPAGGAHAVPCEIWKKKPSIRFHVAPVDLENDPGPGAGTRGVNRNSPSAPSRSLSPHPHERTTLLLSHLGPTRHFGNRGDAIAFNHLPPPDPMDSRSAGLLIVFIGLFAALIGLFTWMGWMNWFGRLPGDIRLEGERTRLYVPLVSMLIVSIVLSVAVSLLRRWL
jgi:hypothetical protein